MAVEDVNEIPAADVAVNDEYLRKKSILTFSKSDTWSAADAFEGTAIFGGTGSGKSTGSGQAIALAMLAAKDARGEPLFGGLVHTAKVNEATAWMEYAACTGRAGDVLIVRADGGHHFNFLAYEHAATVGHSSTTHNLVRLFLVAMEGGRERRQSHDPYWDNAMEQLLSATIDLCLMATGTVSVSDITQIISTAPRSRAQAASFLWQTRKGREGRCAEFLREAWSRRSEMTISRREDLEQVADYFLVDFPGLADRTRSVIVSSFTSRATSLLRSPLRELLCSDPAKASDTFRPELAFGGHPDGRPKILILDLPIKTFHETGRFAQVILKTVFQRAVERRNVKQCPFPTFLWADEAQFFVTSQDPDFQGTARSARAATVYITQNLPTYYRVLGGTSQSAATDSLLGNFQTKIFHSNSDPVTNEWAERLFAQCRVLRPSPSVSLGASSYGGSGQDDNDAIRSRAGRPQMSTSSQTAFEPEVPAATFLKLAKGNSSAGVVEAIVFQAGREWKHNRKTHLRVCFDRRNGGILHEQQRD